MAKSWPRDGPARTEAARPVEGSLAALFGNERARAVDQLSLTTHTAAREARRGDAHCPFTLPQPKSPAQPFLRCDSVAEPGRVAALTTGVPLH
jgi:hypothetical protein